MLVSAHATILSSYGFALCRLGQRTGSGKSESQQDFKLMCMLRNLKMHTCITAEFNIGVRALKFLNLLFL
ncbi:hypothetical protein NDU88_008165 [Pleurodeles waltl]|uniref:Uncharacterized protein n=1 Tax=Pleurodeles waltl TaxID=8319 RepID=A0AAV7NVE4_PLEWA|nr:hypothetical protein NDU88_008165 [Pleurodeles waltl]